MNKHYKNGKYLSYIIKTKNNKHTYFRIKDGYLEVSKSKYLSNSEIIKLIDNRFDDFYNRIKELEEKIIPENKIILENVNYDLELKIGSKKSYQINDLIITVTYPKEDYLKAKQWIYLEHLKVMLNRIHNKVKETLENNNIKVRKLKFGYYKSKFGSYHRMKDEITLNIILAKLDINFLYYVLMHEYAHTKVFNHSKDFYTLLQKLMSNYKHYDKKLKEIAIYI